jgi:DNA repair protein RadD
MQPRDYQVKAKNELYKYMELYKGKNPCLEMPTGSGKSHIVAMVCQDLVQSWPETRILMLTHVKELIEQNAEKMRQYWPNAPMGIYSASVGKKQLGEPITFGGIQSLRSKADLIGHIDIIIIDECHLVSHKEEGSYRGLIDDLKNINPSLVVIGLTATPYRLGFGYITGEGAIFDDIIKPTSIEELVKLGFLAMLRSKKTKMELSTDGVHKRGGEFIEKELQEAVNTEGNNTKIINEVLKRAEDRKHWLFFCTGVDHAETMALLLKKHGISAECLTGQHTKRQRESIIEQYKAGEIKALTNANVLTTGFDFPDIDLIALCRPTMSASLYVQMAGRGMRLKKHADHCLVLDFAGNIERHGPVTNVIPPTKRGGKEGDAPVKPCPNCDELLHAAVMECDACGYIFPPVEKASTALSNSCIMGYEPDEMEVKSWHWMPHTSRTSGKDMIKIKYYGSLTSPVVTEYLTIMHEGAGGERAMAKFSSIVSHCEASEVYQKDSLEDVCKLMESKQPPKILEYTKNGKFFNVIGRSWVDDSSAGQSQAKGHQTA